jgi:magnesium-protoporphyrin IX monomethyl ester (oxidative) cyclase
MRVCLIIPPRYYYKNSFKAGEGADVGVPVGLLTIAAVLEKGGHEVKVIDCLVDRRAEEKKIDDKLASYGLLPRELRKEIEEFRPSVVGISNMFSAQIMAAVETAHLVKMIDSSIKVVVGGAHVSVKGEEFLEQNDSVDFAIVAEGEYTMLELLEAVEGKRLLRDVKGLIYKENGRAIRNHDREFIEPLDELPFPAYHLVDMEAYLSASKRKMYSRDTEEDRAITMITSRGCPFNCVFCSVHIHMGKRWRPHSADYVVRHIKLLVDRYNVKQIHFEDDNISASRKRMHELLDKMMEQDINVKWDTPNGIRADTLDEPLLRKMKKAGCKGLKIGIESGDQYVLDNIIKKNLRLEKVVEIAKLCRKIGIPLGAFYIIGFPGETVKNMENTARFAKMLYRKYGVKQWGAAHATPLYGTELYRICKEQGLLVGEVTPEELSTSGLPFTNSLIKTKDFSQKDLDRINRMMVREMYIDYLRHPLKTVRLLFKIRKRVATKIKDIIKKSLKR